MKKNMLDSLINDWIFDCSEPREFSSSESASRFLVKYLKSEGVKVQVSNQPGYFFCTLAKGKIEVCADSRANLRPRTVKEAICLATLKLYLPDTDKRAWKKVYKALDLTI